MKPQGLSLLGIILLVIGGIPRVYEGFQAWMEWYKEWEWPNFVLVGMGLYFLLRGSSMKALAPEKYVELAKLRTEKRHELLEDGGIVVMFLYLAFFVIILGLMLLFNYLENA